MKKTFLAVLIAVTLALPSFAQEDAGVPVEIEVVSIVDAGVIDAGVIGLADGGTISVNPNVLDDLTPMVLITKKHIENGDWASAVAGVLVLLIGLFRMFAKKIHDFIPDENPIDKFFFFMLETKPGGWILNFLTVTAAGLGSTMLVGEPVTWAIIKPVLMLSFSAAGIWGLVKDLWEWIQKKIEEGKKKEAPPAAPGA